METRKRAGQVDNKESLYFVKGKYFLMSSPCILLWRKFADCQQMDMWSYAHALMFLYWYLVQIVPKVSRFTF